MLPSAGPCGRDHDTSLQNGDGYNRGIGSSSQPDNKLVIDKNFVCHREEKGRLVTPINLRGILTHDSVLQLGIALSEAEERGMAIINNVSYVMPDNQMFLSAAYIRRLGDGKFSVDVWRKREVLTTSMHKRYIIHIMSQDGKIRQSTRQDRIGNNIYDVYPESVACNIHNAIDKTINTGDISEVLDKIGGLYFVARFLPYDEDNNTVICHVITSVGKIPDEEMINLLRRSTRNHIKAHLANKHRDLYERFFDQKIG